MSVSCLVGFHRQPRHHLSGSAFCRGAPLRFLGTQRSYQLVPSDGWIGRVFLLHQVKFSSLWHPLSSVLCSHSSAIPTGMLPPDHVAFSQAGRLAFPWIAFGASGPRGALLTALLCVSFLQATSHLAIQAALAGPPERGLSRGVRPSLVPPLVSPRPLSCRVMSLSASPTRFRGPRGGD